MAKIQYSALVTQIKGKMRGAIFQSGTAGQIVRSAKNFNRTASLTWQRQKNRAAYVASAWQALTADERAAWASIAVNMPAQNSFGEQRIPTGYAVYCKVNMIVLGTGGALMTSPSMPVQLTNIGSITGVATPPSILQFNTGAVISSSELLIVDASTPMNSSRKNPPTGFKRVGNYYNPFSVVYDIGPDYAAVFGTPPVGSRIIINAYVFNAYTGQKSIRYSTNIPVV